MEAVVKEECPSMDTNTASLKDVLDETTFCISPTDKSDDGMMTPALSSSRKILCQVCGALSSGLHFGVFTCEGCKCFYRRSIKEGANYACAKDRNCDITMETRNSCRFCRFQKCLALGMSKEGIKLGRRPKVDSDVFQQGFYHTGDMDMLRSHGPQTYSWPGTDHLGTHYPSAFKSEPAFGDMETRGKDGYSEQAVMNYSLKREAYTTCEQHNGLHYPHHGGYLMQSQQPDAGMPSPGSREHYEQIYGSPMECGVHPQQQVYLPPDAHPHPHHSTPMSNPVPIMHAPSQPPTTQSTIGQGTSRSWSAELSPTSSMSSSSEETWEGTVFQGNHPSSVTLTLPEVHSGAVAAMAYANLYRGKNESPSSTSSSLSAAERSQDDEISLPKKPSEMSFSLPNELERDSRSYTELVPRKTIQKHSSVLQAVGERQEVIGYANKLQAAQNSITLSPKPASPACGNNNNNSEAWVGHPDGKQQSQMSRGESARLLDLSHPHEHLKMRREDNEAVRDIQGSAHLLHDITSHFLELKMNIVAQWKVYHSKVSSNDSPDISWDDVESFMNSTHTITDHIRAFVYKVLSLARQTCTSGLELIWTSLAVVVKTCLLLDISSSGQLRARGERDPPQLLQEEAACICILTLFSSVAVSGGDAVVVDACQWICQAARDYLREKCETEERFQQVIQLLQGDSAATVITSPT